MSLYENAQWAVTDAGLESIRPDPPCVIEAPTLTATLTHGDDVFYEWPLHVAEKSWAKIDLFIDAYTRALALHGGSYQPPEDLDLLERSCAKARHIARRKLALRI